MALKSDSIFSGEINIGGAITTGNTDTARLDAEINTRFSRGRLEENYRLLGELATDNNNVTAQRFLVSSESLLNLENQIFGFSFIEFEDDRFSGFKFEVEGSIGAGYKIINYKRMRFLLQGGPGYRLSKKSLIEESSIDNIKTSESLFTIRTSARLEYEISENTDLNNNLNMTWDKERTTIENTFAITNNLIGNLSTRISFNFRYNTSPPIETKKTDTYTRISLVYNF